MVAAEVNGAKRYIMLSSINAHEESTSRIAHYHRAKARADRQLRETGLEYTIVCPGRLTDEDGSGLVSVSPDTTGSGLTAREILAE